MPAWSTAAKLATWAASGSRASASRRDPRRCIASHACGGQLHAFGCSQSSCWRPALASPPRRPLYFDHAALPGMRWSTALMAFELNVGSSFSSSRRARCGTTKNRRPPSSAAAAAVAAAWDFVPPPPVPPPSEPRRRRECALRSALPRACRPALSPPPPPPPPPPPAEPLPLGTIGSDGVGGRLWRDASISGASGAEMISRVKEGHAPFGSCSAAGNHLHHGKRQKRGVSNRQHCEAMEGLLAMGALRTV